uniref:Cofilin n=1 Tax=Rhipicephalus appendiculatus TaxID=34631 RepID=A0A131YTB1_RHIAP
MSAGVTVSDEAKAVYEALKTDKKHRYIVYQVIDEHVIEAESTGERSATFEDFLEKLRQSDADQCRCVLYDYTATADDGTTRDKTVLLKWCPEKVNIKQRMMYSSALQVLLKEFAGIDHSVEAYSVEEAEDAMKAAVCQ